MSFYQGITRIDWYLLDKTKFDVKVWIRRWLFMAFRVRVELYLTLGYPFRFGTFYLNFYFLEGFMFHKAKRSHILKGILPVFKLWIVTVTVVTWIPIETVLDSESGR